MRAAAAEASPLPSPGSWGRTEECVRLQPQTRGVSAHTRTHTDARFLIRTFHRFSYRGTLTRFLVTPEAEAGPQGSGSLGPGSFHLKKKKKTHGQMLSLFMFLSYNSQCDCFM